MNSSNVLRSVCVVLITAACARASATTEPASVVPQEVKELDDSILAHRRAIKTGHIRITITGFREGVAESRREEQTIFFDGLRVRRDRRAKGVTAIDSYGDEWYYRWCDASIEGGGQYVLLAHQLKYANRQVDPIYDPRMAMLCLTWLEGTYDCHMETLINSPGRKDFRIERVIWDGETAVKVSCTRISSGRMIRYWVVPGRGYSIVRIESVANKANSISDNKAGEISDAVQCTLQHVRDDIWFPKAVQFRRARNGKEILGQDLVFEVLSLNEPLDPNSFEPVTMNIRPNTVVSRSPPDPRGMLKWDGQRFIVMKKDEILEMSYKKDAGSDSNRRLRYLVLSGVCATLAGVILLRRYSRKPAKAVP